MDGKSFQFVGLLILGMVSIMGTSCFAEEIPSHQRISNKQHTFVIGKISDNPKKHYPFLKPMADYLANQLGEFGFIKGDVLLARDTAQMLQFIQQGKIDLITETLFTAIILEQKATVEMLLLKRKKGSAYYKSLIFVLADSGIERLADLRGKKIAFEDPGSTSAYFIPAAILLNHQLKLFNISSMHDKVPQNKLGYLFSGEEINSSVWVYQKIVDAAVISDVDWEKSSRMPEQYKQDLRIIYESAPIPRAIELVHSNLPTAVKQKIKSLLLNAHINPALKSTLFAYQETTQFDPIDETVKQYINQARELLLKVNSELN